MTPNEAVALCRFTAACCPSQKIDEYTPDAWGLLLEDIRFVDAKDAVTRVARKQPWVSPAEIIAEVKKIRAKRIAEYGPIVPPTYLDPDDTKAYRDWWINTQQAIADGVMKPLELDKPDPAGQQAVKELISGTFLRVPGGRNDRP